MKVKETVRSLLDRRSENCTLDDVLYHLCVLQSIERGRSDVKAGRTIPHEEVERDLPRLAAQRRRGISTDEASDAPNEAR